EIEARLAQVRAVLDAYVKGSGGKVEYSVIEVKDAETKSDAEAKGMVAVPAGILADDVAARKPEGPRGFLGITLRATGESGANAQAAIPFVDRTSDLDFTLTRALQDLRLRATGNERVFAVINGHGEQLPETSLLAPVHEGSKDPAITFERVWHEF